MLAAAWRAVDFPVGTGQEAAAVGWDSASCGETATPYGFGRISLTGERPSSCVLDDGQATWLWHRTVCCRWRSISEHTLA